MQPSLTDYKPRFIISWPLLAKAIIAVGTAILVFKLFTLPARQEGQRAQEFCESLMPALESYRRVQGHYPATIETLLQIGTQLPQLLDGRKFYASDGISFTFYFRNPAALTFSNYGYDSRRHEWQRWK